MRTRLRLPVLLASVLVLVAGLTTQAAAADGPAGLDLSVPEAAQGGPAGLDSLAPQRALPDRERMPERPDPAPDAVPLADGEVLPLPGGDATTSEVGAASQPQTIVFIHGLDKKASSGSQSHNCGSYFADLLNDFPNRGYGGALHTVGYYDGNTNCSHWLHNYGNASAHFGNGTNSLTSGTSIRHVGYRFAWYLWHEHTSQGRSVGIVSHSMGGLVSRYAVGMTAAGHPDFPPYLSVRNLATVGTPHTGSGLAWFCFSVQCSELRPGSATLAAINNVDNGPSGVLNRIAVASYYDEAVSESSAIAMPAAAWVSYDWPWYTHSGLLRDTSQSWSASYIWGDAAGNSGSVYPGPRSGTMIYTWSTAG